MGRSPGIGGRIGGCGHGFPPNESIALAGDRPSGRGLGEDHEDLRGRHGIEDLELGVFVVKVIPAVRSGVQRGRCGPMG